MKDDIKNLIAAARSAYPDMKTVQRLCDELEKSAQFNEDTLKIKIGLAEENQRLRQELELKSASGYPVNASQNLIEQLIEQTQKLLNPPQVGIPPMSPECFRQHAVLSALNGLLAGDGYRTYGEKRGARIAVDLVDALVKELAK